MKFAIVGSLHVERVVNMGRLVGLVARVFICMDMPVIAVLIKRFLTSIIDMSVVARVVSFRKLVIVFSTVAISSR